MSEINAVALGTILNHEYQAGKDAATLRGVALAIRDALPEYERGAFTEAVEMCGLWLDAARAMASRDPVTQRAEGIREQAGIPWEYACRIAEEERDACATLGIDFGRFCEMTPALGYSGR